MVLAFRFEEIDGTVNQNVDQSFEIVLYCPGENVKSGIRDMKRGSGICDPGPRSQGGRARVTCGECDFYTFITIAVFL